MSTEPGWYNAQGDPMGTVRWWDGTQWVGEPQVQPNAAVGVPAAAAGFPGAPPTVAMSSYGERYPDRGAVEWYKLAWSRWKTFDGRSRRAEYWWFTLGNAIVMVPVYVIGMIGIATETGVGTAIGVIFFLLYLLFSLAIIVPSIAVAVRRLHDTGRSGWFMLLSFVPCVSLVLLVFMFMDGLRGPNQYGIDPKGIG